MLADIFQRNLIGLFTIRLSEVADLEQNTKAELQIRLEKVLIPYQLNFNKLYLFPF